MNDADVKRINVRCPITLYNRLKEYCDTVNVPVSSAMCLFSDLMLNQLSADRMSRASEAMVKKLDNLQPNKMAQVLENISNF